MLYGLLIFILIAVGALYQAVDKLDNSLGELYNDVKWLRQHDPAFDESEEECNN